MGAFDFTWNAIQSGQIHEAEDKIEELENKIEVLCGWILQLKERIEALENEQTNQGTGSAVQTPHGQ